MLCGILRFIMYPQTTPQVAVVVHPQRDSEFEYGMLERVLDMSDRFLQGDGGRGEDIQIHDQGQDNIRVP